MDIEAAGVDAYSMSCHKWLQSPKGLGLLYAPEHTRERVPRMWFKTPAAGLDGTARDYEDYSTRAWPAVVALGDALDFQAALGQGEKTRRYRALWSAVRDRVDREPGLAWRSPGDFAMGSMIMAVAVRGREAMDLAPALIDEIGAVVRPFPGPVNALRVSPNLATSERDLDRFFDRLVEKAV